MGRNDIARLTAHFSKNDPLVITIITMSDRAHAGEYEDEGGPAIYGAVTNFFNDLGIAHVTDRILLPDEPVDLRSTLITSRENGVHVVFTTGGTGVGPRDITPDVVLELSDKTIPGIMELIRVKYGMEKPLAALSRTIATVMGKTLVFTLPGSPKGVAEYMNEILKTIDHLLCIVHGIDDH